MPEIKLRRGNAASLPILGTGEPALAMDTQTLYYGTGTQNINLTPIRWIGSTPEFPSGSNTIGRYTLNISSPLVENSHAIDLRAYISGGVKLDQIGAYSFASGYGTKAQGSCSFVANKNNTAQGTSTFVTGEGNVADGNAHHCLVGGRNNSIYSAASLCVGRQNSVQAVCGLSSGANLTCESYLLTTLGRFNNVSPGAPESFNFTNNALVIGNGSSTSAKSNCFRVRFDGNVYGLAAFNSVGADYAEFFEWEDGNPDLEDRVGRFVYLTKDDKISICGDAIPASSVLGVVSATPAVKGNTASSNWHKMYLKDDFGRTLYEENSEGEVVPKINPAYKPEENYTPRESRPEWDAIGFLGRLRVHDDGSCVSGGYCSCGANGIAIKSTEGFKVLKRISTNVVEILLK